MHPSTASFLALDHIADLERQARRNQVAASARPIGSQRSTVANVGGVVQSVLATLRPSLRRSARPQPACD